MVLVLGTDRRPYLAVPFRGRCRPRRLVAVTTVAMVGSALVAMPGLAISDGTPAATGGHDFVAKINTVGCACTGALVSPTWIMTAAGHVAHVVNLVPRTDRNLMLAQLDTPITDIAPVA